MLPLKDNIPTDRLPIVTLLLIAAGVCAHVLGAGDSVLQLLTCALFLWIFGTNVEDATSRPRFIAYCLLGGGAALALGRAVDAEATATVVGATGAVSAVLGGYVRLFPHARIITLVLVPFAFTLVEVRVWFLLGAWALLQALFALTGVSGPLADGGAAILLGCAGGFAFGLAAIPLFALHRKQLPPSPPAIAAWS